MMCLPTWVGFVFSYVLISKGFFNYVPIGSPEMNIYLAVFLNGVIASGAVYIVNTAVEYLEAFSLEDEDEDDDGPQLMHG